ncbi:MAG: hypothetical protein N4A35_03610 [Flavobacteriales bacterium]|nr:hypothetical protein [Flavobacteriales bacterium]
MKITFTFILTLGFTLLYGQQIPTKDRALKDIKLKTESIEKQLEFFGVQSGLEAIKIEHSGGPYRKYSTGARTFYYDHVADFDAAYHKFTLTTPQYPNGDQFTFDLIISYNSYHYLHSGYRKSLGKYKLNIATISVKSYKGKELTTTQLIEKLNDLSKEQGKAFEVDNKYHFTQIETIGFERKEQRIRQGVTYYEYEIKIKGKGAKYESSAGDYIEYEIRETADITAYYTADIGLINGKWKFTDYSLKQDFNKIEVTNVEKDPNVPAYQSLRNLSLKEILAGPQISKEISVYSIKYMNDLKSLVLLRLTQVPKEEFIKGELLTTLFSTEAGQSAFNQFYNLKQTMKDYYLDSVQLGFASNRTQIEKGGQGQFSVSYRVKRTASKDLFKKAKANGASKEQLNIIKYPAQGYYNLSIDLKVENGKILIDDVISPNGANQIKYKNGGSTRSHPITIVE